MAMNVRISRFTLAGLAGLNVLSASWLVLAKPPSSSVSGLVLNDLAWMAGRWQDEQAASYTDEHWTVPKGGSMVGMCRIGEEASTSMYEMLLIEEKHGQLVYTMEHFGPGLKHRDKEPLVFDVVRGSGDHEVRFVGRDKNRPTRLTYRLVVPDRLGITLERHRDGKDLRDAFSLVRAK